MAKSMVVGAFAAVVLVALGGIVVHTASLRANRGPHVFQGKTGPFEPPQYLIPKEAPWPPPPKIFDGPETAPNPTPFLHREKPARPLLIDPT